MSMSAVRLKIGRKKNCNTFRTAVNIVLYVISWKNNWQHWARSSCEGLVVLHLQIGFIIVKWYLFYERITYKNLSDRYILVKFYVTYQLYFINESFKTEFTSFTDYFIYLVWMISKTKAQFSIYFLTLFYKYLSCKFKVKKLYSFFGHQK